MSYHKLKICKHNVGSPWKLQEEVLEYIDAVSNDNPVMAANELSDLYGVIEEEAKKYGLTMDNLKTMSDLTKQVLNDKLKMPHDILDDKKSCEESIDSHIYLDIAKKYEYLRAESRFGENEGFDKDKFKEYCDIMRDETNKAREFIQSQPDNVEFEYMGHRYTKNISVDDPEMIYSLLVSGHHFDD